MKYRSRIDDNQREVVEVLRSLGCSVQSLATIGNGCPDLVVGRNGVNILVEVKDGKKPLSKQKLTDMEKVWHSKWKGKVVVIKCMNEAASLGMAMSKLNFS